MKRTIALMLIGILSVHLAACSGVHNSADSNTVSGGSAAAESEATDAKAVLTADDVTQGVLDFFAAKIKPDEFKKKFGYPYDVITLCREYADDNPSKINLVGGIKDFKTVEDIDKELNAVYYVDNGRAEFDKKYKYTSELSLKKNASEMVGEKVSESEVQSELDKLNNEVIKSDDESLVINDIEVKYVQIEGNSDGGFAVFYAVTESGYYYLGFSAA
ncbi:MAG: hypothetical protein E7571_00730 [Ruminococcaceae bacterium]|nr:hypothetical protein [Oscillospiraceae bacterium]